jgi:uncharacterized membrane protein YfcA
MDSRILGKILVFWIVFSSLFGRLIYPLLSKNLFYLFLLINLVIIIIFFFWANRNIGFSNKQDSLRATAQNRINILQQLGVFDYLTVFIIIAGIFSILFGIGALFFSYFPKGDPRTFQFFGIWVVFGLILLAVARSNWKRLKK